VRDGRPRRRVLLRRPPGQGMTEYALILILVAIVVLAVLTTMGQQASTAIQEAVNWIKRLL
jgi:Flp pilus assembly pilin Flp